MFSTLLPLLKKFTLNEIKIFKNNYKNNYKIIIK